MSRRVRQSARDGPAIATDLRSLLRMTDSVDLSSLSDSVYNRVGPHIGEVFELDYGVDVGVEVRVASRGTYLEYPFAEDELWSAVDDLEAEADFDSACRRLEDEIREVERLDVYVYLDYYCDLSRLKPSHRRRQLNTGVVVQEVGDYPYRRALSGRKTYCDWLSNRFGRHFPGLTVDLNVPLSGLRELHTAP